MAMSNFEATQLLPSLTQSLQSEKTLTDNASVGNRVDQDRSTLTSTPSVRGIPSLNPTSPGLSMVPKRRKCARWCVCTCHSRTNLKTPWAVTALLGELNVRHNGRTQLQCNCLEPSSLAVTYRFPEYLLRRYVSFAVQYSWSSPELLLRVPRVMPWDHKLWRYLIDGDLAAVQRMYALGLASPHDISGHGSNSLILAHKSENLDLIHFLLDQGVDCNHATFIGDTPGEMLWDRACGGYYGVDGSAILRKVLDGNDGLDGMGFSTLHLIILGIMYKDIRTALQSAMVSIDATDSRRRTPLHWAVICDDEQAVKTLLEFGADPNIKDSAGYFAIDFMRSAGVCKCLLKAGSRWGSNPLKKGRSTLHRAVTTGVAGEVVDILVNAGVNVNAVNHDRETPLMNALYWGRTEIAEHLIALGANLDVANISSQDSAIHFAALFDRPEILPLLLEKGPDYTATNVHGWDLGHCAAMFAGLDFINVMTRSNLKKLNLDKPDRDGKTAKDLMNGRTIMKAQEIGVHEAFEALAASLSPYSQLVVHCEESLDALEAQKSMETGVQTPGSFPVTSDSKKSSLLLDSFQSYRQMMSYL